MTDLPQNPPTWTPQGPYPYPPTPAYYPPQKRTNGLAIASLVLGIVWGYWIGSILAVIFAFVAKRQIRESNGTQSGDGLATAGLVLGLVGVATLVLFIMILALATSHGSQY